MTMSPDLKARLRAGRERALAARQAREDVELAEFRAWLSLEAGAFARYRDARETFGTSDETTRAAREEWRAAMSLCPQLPADAAFARERGE